MHFTLPEFHACQKLVALALEEDLGGLPAAEEGDVTSCALIGKAVKGQAALVARQTGVLAGLPAVAVVLDALDKDLQLHKDLEDGVPLAPNTQIGVIRGRMRSLLAGERIALNFLQRLSGIASRTRLYVEAVAGLPCRILDTRKTTPGWRLLEKYAVRCGGGQNHRLGLHDGILIKDNHLAVNARRLTIQKALQLARESPGGRLPIVIEVDDLKQLEKALLGGPDIILLDNMNLEQLRDAARIRNEVAPRVQLEASGNVTLSVVRAIAETGVDRISVGELTHSAPALDIGLDYIHS